MRIIALSSISPGPGFNPRTAHDPSASRSSSPRSRPTACCSRCSLPRARRRPRHAPARDRAPRAAQTPRGVRSQIAPGSSRPRRSSRSPRSSAHPGLAGYAVARIDSRHPTRGRRPLTWAGRIADPRPRARRRRRGPGHGAARRGLRLGGSPSQPGGSRSPTGRVSSSSAMRPDRDAHGGVRGVLRPRGARARLPAQGRPRHQGRLAAPARRQDPATNSPPTTRHGQRPFTQTSRNGAETAAEDDASAPSEKELNEQRHEERAEQKRAHAAAVAHHAELGSARDESEPYERHHAELRRAVGAESLAPARR